MHQNYNQHYNQNRRPGTGGGNYQQSQGRGPGRSGPGRSGPGRPGHTFNSQSQQRYEKKYRESQSAIPQFRSANTRRTVTFYPSVIRGLKFRTEPINRDLRKSIPIFAPHPYYARDELPPYQKLTDPISSICTKFVHTSINKVKTAIFCATWSKDARRLITGTHSGEFTMWKDHQFNFDTILQAHDHPIRAIKFSDDGEWFISGDQTGIIKYWESTLNCTRMKHAHNAPLRDLSLSPTNHKFATCSDDSTIKIWDFRTAVNESTLRGHSWDIKTVDWNPYLGLIASGSKDQMIKLWDPRTQSKANSFGFSKAAGSQAACIATIGGHKNTVTKTQWNPSRHYWLLSASRDSTCKLWDIRMLYTAENADGGDEKSSEKAFKKTDAAQICTFRGHESEVSALAWHPVQSELFVSGDQAGKLMFWLPNTSDQPVAFNHRAHEDQVWTLTWHPLGHLLVSGSNDHTTKFWCRNRPGDPMLFPFNIDVRREGVFNGTYPFFGFKGSNEEIAKYPQITVHPEEIYGKQFTKDEIKILTSYSTLDRSTAKPINPLTLPGLQLPGLSALPGLSKSSVRQKRGRGADSTLPDHQDIEERTQLINKKTDEDIKKLGLGDLLESETTVKTTETGESKTETEAGAESVSTKTTTDTIAESTSESIQEDASEASSEEEEEDDTDYLSML